MTDREKLVELLDYISYSQEFSCYDLYDMSDAAESIADFLISKGVTVREWISVEDRLPEVEQGFSGNPQAYEFSKPVLATVAGYVMLGRFTYWHGGAFEFDGVDADFDRDQPVGVTHWMPLPEPLKEE